jgi:hypothetical protein
VQPKATAKPEDTKKPETATQPAATAQPQAPASTEPTTGSGPSGGAAAKPKDTAKPQETAKPQKAAVESSGTAPTKWPARRDKPKSVANPSKINKSNAKPSTVSKPKPRPRRRLRTVIKRKPPPKPAKARPIPINPAAPAKYAGTYRIESWQSIEKKGLYHFFYLRPGGDFLLGAEWPGRETSRAAGDWRASGGQLSLKGTISVSTNKGRWKVPFQRTFRIGLGDHGIRLEPVLERNRFGLLGWPNAYYFYRTRVSPNLPSRKIPQDADKLDALIARLRNSSR